MSTVSRAYTRYSRLKMAKKKKVGNLGLSVEPMQPVQENNTAQQYQLISSHREDPSKHVLLVLINEMTGW